MYLHATCSRWPWPTEGPRGGLLELRWNTCLHPTHGRWPVATEGPPGDLLGLQRRKVRASLACVGTPGQEPTSRAPRFGRGHQHSAVSEQLRPPPQKPRHPCKPSTPS